MADLSSSSTSLRLIMTSRAKLAEVAAALTTAAAAASSSGPAGQASANAAAGGSSPRAASGAPALTALPLQPWAWPWSAQCGCNSRAGGWSGSSSSGGGGESAGGCGAQVLRVQHPPLAAVLQEMANTAASIHRRVMIYLRSCEAAMQS